MPGSLDRAHSPMRALLLNTYDVRGGAARAIFRILGGLRQLGLDARMVVQRKLSQHPDVVQVASEVAARLRPYIDYAAVFACSWTKIGFFPGLLPNPAVLRLIDEVSPDVVHLNWVSEGFLSPETIAAIDRPLVWTCQDSWAFTGGCHCPLACVGYQDRCGRCPVLGSRREHDLSSWTQVRRARAYARIRDLTVVATSRWLQDAARASRVFAGRPVTVIPNGLDCTTYQPRDRDEARQRLGLEPCKRLVLYGAVNATRNPVKGFPILLEALESLARRDAVLVVFGCIESRPAVASVGSTPVLYLPPVEDELELSKLYSAADVMVVPSTQEGFGQTVTESLACGTPVVAFDATGPRDIVTHELTGYLARPFHPDDLARGIDWVLDLAPPALEAMRQRCRAHATEHFAIEQVSKSYLELYSRVASVRPTSG